MSENRHPPKIVNYLLPKLGEIIFAAVFLAVIGLGPRLMNVDGDLGRHLTLGNYILDSRAIPTEDIFSFSKFGDSLTPHEWLSDVLFALVYRLGGLNGVVWLTALVVAVTAWLIYYYSYKLSGMNILAAVIAVLGAAASSLHWLTRPHIFTILLTIIWTILLDRLRFADNKGWIYLPLTMLLWVNLHGAFFAGLLIWLCYFVGTILKKGASRSQIKTYLWVGLTSFLVTLFNPDGLKIWQTSFRFLGSEYLVGHTAEYLPPDFLDSSTWPFLIFLVGSLIILLINTRKIPIPHLLIIGGWSLLALYSARNIPLFVAASSPFICAALAGLLEDKKSMKSIKQLISFQSGLQKTETQLKGGLWSLVVVLAAAVLLLTGALLDFDQQGNSFSRDVFPVEAVNWLEENQVEGNGFNYFPWGGYLLFRLWPDNLVFIDGQTDFYGEQLTRQYELIITLGDGWQQVLADYQIEWVLMPADSLLISEVESRQEWTIVYSDNTSTLAILSGNHLIDNK